MIFGIVEGDVIANVIEAETLEIAQEVAGEGVEVVEGASRGWVRTADGWAATVVPPVKRDLSALEFEMHVQDAADLSDDDVLAMLDDPALRLFWRRLNQANLIAPDHPLVADGLNALVSLGHLDAAQRQAVVDSWPVA